MLTGCWVDVVLDPANARKHNDVFSAFFKTIRETIDHYDRTVKKVDFSMVKNIVVDYKLKQACLERELAKKRTTAFTVFDVNKKSSLIDTEESCLKMKNPSYKPPDSWTDSSKVKVINTLLGLTRPVSVVTGESLLEYGKHKGIRSQMTSQLQDFNRLKKLREKEADCGGVSKGDAKARGKKDLNLFLGQKLNMKTSQSKGYRMGNESPNNYHNLNISKLSRKTSGLN